MKGLLFALGAVLLAGLAVGAASAQYYPGSRPQAPDACGPGYYATSEQCGTYGPNYDVYPSFPPVGGVPPYSVPTPGHSWWLGSLFHHDHQRGFATFPTHPFARSPRDYFMLDLP